MKFGALRLHPKGNCCLKGRERSLVTWIYMLPYSISWRIRSTLRFTYHVQVSPSLMYCLLPTLCSCFSSFNDFIAISNFKEKYLIITYYFQVLLYILSRLILIPHRIKKKKKKEESGYTVVYSDNKLGVYCSILSLLR